jgi:hypothetical protein
LGQKLNASFPEGNQPILSNDNLDHFPSLCSPVIQDTAKDFQLVRRQILYLAVTLIGAKIHELAEYFCGMLRDFVFKMGHFEKLLQETCF